MSGRGWVKRKRSSEKMKSFVKEQKHSISQSIQWGCCNSADIPEQKCRKEKSIVNKCRRVKVSSQLISPALHLVTCMGMGYYLDNQYILIARSRNEINKRLLTQGEMELVNSLDSGNGRKVNSHSLGFSFTSAYRSNRATRSIRSNSNDRFAMKRIGVPGSEALSDR